MRDEITLTSCAECGITFGLSELFLQRRRSDHAMFYCPNMHANYFEKPKPPVPIPPKVIEKEVEVIVEKVYEPKNWTEMLKMHEHDFTKKTRGQLACQMCGLYKGVYDILTTNNTD